jgi:hypothetical protein
MAGSISSTCATSMTGSCAFWLIQNIDKADRSGFRGVLRVMACRLRGI